MRAEGDEFDGLRADSHEEGKVQMGNRVTWADVVASRGQERSKVNETFLTKFREDLILSKQSS